MFNVQLRQRKDALELAALVNLPWKDAFEPAQVDGPQQQFDLFQRPTSTAREGIQVQGKLNALNEKSSVNHPYNRKLLQPHLNAENRIKMKPILGYTSKLSAANVGLADKGNNATAKGSILILFT